MFSFLRFDSRALPFIISMVIIIVLSNILVLFPLSYIIFGIDLSVILTWGAFVYPLSFLVNDLTNRTFGVRHAQIVVLVGFFIAILLSTIFATPRIAVASGIAFLVAHCLDLSIFSRLRRLSWWIAPLISSFLASFIDTLLFFSLAFAPTFSLLNFGGVDGSLGFSVPFLSIGLDVPLWLSLAAGDLTVKIFVALCALVFYGVFITRIFPHTSLGKLKV